MLKVSCKWASTSAVILCCVAGQSGACQQLSGQILARQQRNQAIMRVQQHVHTQIHAGQSAQSKQHAQGK
jgi:hypothetical protein